MLAVHAACTLRTFPCKQCQVYQGMVPGDTSGDHSQVLGAILPWKNYVMSLAAWNHSRGSVLPVRGIPATFGSVKIRTSDEILGGATHSQQGSLQVELLSIRPCRRMCGDMYMVLSTAQKSETHPCRTRPCLSQIAPGEIIRGGLGKARRLRQARKDQSIVETTI